MTTTATAGRAPKLLRLSVILLAVAAVFGVITTFSNGSYDWDLDHEVYFGQRLLAGELIWTKGFHDKLPFTQMVFSIPALFSDSVLVFRVMSLSSVLGGSAALFLLLPSVIDMDGIPARSRLWTLAFGALFFIALSSLQIAGLTSVNPVSASFALIASLLMLTTMRRDDDVTFRLLLALFVGSFFAAASISLRPYFIAPLAVTFLFAALTGASRARSRRAVMVPVLWVLSTGLWGLLTNLMPYIVTGELQAFRDGLTTLAYDMHSRSFVKSLARAALQPQAIITIIAWAVTLALLATQMRFIRQERGVARFVALLAISVLSLFAMLAALHFWPHYFNFFTGYLALACTVSILGWQRADAGNDAPQADTTTNLSGYLVVFLAGATSIWSLILMTSNFGRPHNEALELAALQSYLAETGRKGEDVHAPTSMYFQWKLRSPISVLPHAANAQHICYGWTQQISPVRSFPLPRTEPEYCRLLVDEAHPLIVEEVLAGKVPDCDWLSCLLSNDYLLDREIALNNGTVLRLYLRVELP